jgi:hypothetical protein
MNSSRWNAVLFLVLAGCGTRAGEPGGGMANKGDELAGGQSGSDSSGGYSCELEDAVETSLALDEVIGLSCSAQHMLDVIEGSRSYECKVFGMTLSVTVERGTSARLVTGKRYSDTDTSSPPTDCVALHVDAATSIAASDGSLSLSSSQVTVDHLCSSASIDGVAERTSEGTVRALTFALLDSATRLFVIEYGGEIERTDNCELLP